MGTNWQRVSIEIPKGYAPAEREAIADDIIEKIIERTQSGKDKDGRDFPDYTKKYAEEKGVGVGDVDLTLSSELLNNIELLTNKSGKIVIGFERGSQENAKADGNIRGTYGRSKEDPTKARDFLGITEKELEQVLEKYPLTSNERYQSTIENMLAREIASSLEIDFEL